MKFKAKSLGTAARIPKYCRSDDIESPADKYSLKYLIPDYMSNLRFGKKLNEDEYEDEDEETDVEENVNESEEPLRSANGQLDKWDKGARSWLSAGTLFLLIILFHVIQMRSDLRRFTSAANTQIAEACGILDDKTESLQTALSLAAKDVGPVTLKFVRDLKTKLRSAFHFAGQVFGGRIRTFLVNLLGYKYCILVGIVVVLKSLIESVIQLILSMFPDGANNFINSVLEGISSILKQITEFMTQPGELFAELLKDLMERVVDPDLIFIIIPDISIVSLTVCSKLKRLKFDEIEQLLHSYVNKLIIALAVMLVLFNTFQFVRTVEVEYSNDELEDEKEEGEEDDEIEKDDDIEEDYDDEPPSTINNVSNWVFNFLSYEPFWIFLTMGIFGVLHSFFSKALHEKAQEIKKTIIDPQIEVISNEFVKEVSTFLQRLEKSWGDAFKEVVRPITNFVEYLSGRFEPILSKIEEYGKHILDTVKAIFDYLKVLSALKDGLKAVLDCLILGKISFFVRIGTMIITKLVGDHWSKYDGGVLHLLQNSIQSIFQKLKVTKYLKKMISVSFLIFLRLVAKRSIFLYVYLIVCAILISQGVIMIVIKFLLEEF